MSDNDDFVSLYEQLISNNNEILYIAGIVKKYTDNELEQFIKNENIRDKLIKLLSNKMILSYKTTLLIYAKSTIYNKLCNLKSIAVINDIFDQQYNALQTVIYTNMILRNSKIYMGSFNKFFLFTKKDGKIIKADEILAYEIRHEIYNRLQNLIEYFGMFTLMRMNIPKKKYSVLNSMDCNDLIEYYNNVTMKIKKNIDNYLCYCDSYMELEKIFMLTIINKNIDMKINNFDFNIVVGYDDIEIDLPLSKKIMDEMGIKSIDDFDIC